MAIINGGYKKYKLNNGLVVALQNTPTQTVFGKLRINSGAFHEKKGEEGLAHFLEHCLVMGGSDKYNAELSDKIRCSLDYFNASTNIGRTFLVGDVLINNLESWVDFVSESVLRPRFDKAKCEGERGRVLREIADSKSNSTYSQNRELNRLLYRGHPKGLVTLGKEDIIKNTSLDKIKQFYSERFYPNNMDLILAGGLPANIEEIIDSCFGDASSGQDTRIDFPEGQPLKGKKVIHKYTPEICNKENPEDSSARLIICTATPAEQHPDSYALKIISQILGGDANSYLFNRMGVERGLAYYVSSSYDGNYNFGELNINASVPANRIDEALDTAFEEINRMKNQKVSDKRMERIKRIVQYKAAKTFESNEGHISAIETLLDYNLTPELMIEGFSSVTPATIQEVANKYLPDREKGDYLIYIRDPLKK